MDPVSTRRQELNDLAYKQVLQLLFVKNKTDGKAIMLMGKLRKELNISATAHKTFMSEVQNAKASGTLQALLSQNDMAPQQSQPIQHTMQHAIHAHPPPYMPQPVQQFQQPMVHQHQAMPSNSNKPQRNTTKKKRAVVMNDDSGSDDTVSAGDSMRTGGGAAPSTVTALPSNLPALIGCKVHRYWPKDGQWFDGIVTDYRAKDNLYCITYNIGKKNESMEWFDIDKANSIGNPQYSHYQLTHERVDMSKHSNTRAFQNSSVLNSGKKKGDKGKGSSKKRATSDSY